MADSQHGDLIATNAAENVGERLGLKYEYVMAPEKAIVIIVATVSLLLSILWLQNITTQWDLLYPICSLAVFVRLAFGSPMVRRLTPESRQRLLEWLQSEAAHTESSHAKSNE